MRRYLEPTDSGAFVDFPKKEKRHSDYIECPVCMGHGGWNLTLNAFPNSIARGDVENTPENRHNYSHFRSSCNQCHSWGWLPAEAAVCIHEYRVPTNVGRCLNEYECKKCSHKEVIDSSD